MIKSIPCSTLHALYLDRLCNAFYAVVARSIVDGH